MPDERSPGELPLDAARLDTARVVKNLSAHLILAREKGGARRTLFVSPEASTGTTTLALCTALALAREFHRSVAVVEANLLAPAAALYLGLPAGPGIQEVLHGRSSREDALRNSAVSGLHLLAAGEPGDGPRIGVAHPDVLALIEETTREHELALIDGPPLLDQPVGRVLLKCADQVVLVVRAGTTTKNAAQEAVQAIHSAGVPLLGVIMNGFRPQSPLGIADRRWL